MRCDRRINFHNRYVVVKPFFFFYLFRKWWMHRWYYARSKKKTIKMALHSFEYIVVSGVNTVNEKSKNFWFIVEASPWTKSLWIICTLNFAFVYCDVTYNISIWIVVCQKLLNDRLSNSVKSSFRWLEKKREIIQKIFALYFHIGFNKFVFFNGESQIHREIHLHMRMKICRMTFYKQCCWIRNIW